MGSSLMANLTLGPPPPGVVSNFDNPETMKSQGEISMTFCMAVGAVAIVLRLYVKMFITKLYGWDDFWCILAYIGVVAHDVVSISFMGTGKGKMLGAHMWDIRVVDLTKATLQKVLAAVCLYAAAALFVKLSLFCLYLRLFKIKTGTRWLIYLGIGACFIVYTASVIANCIWFVPPPGQPQTLQSWSAHSANLGSRPYTLATFQGVFGTLSDIYLLAIPVQSILALNMPLGKRIGVSMIFMTGIIAIACSVGSLVFRIKGLSSTDAMWDTIMVYIFSSAEVTAGIVCASTPVCAAFFRGGHSNFFASFSQRYFSRLRSSRKSYGIPAGGSKDLSGQNSNNVKPRRKRGDLDSESIDDLFTMQESSVWDSTSRPVELQSVVAK